MRRIARIFWICLGAMLALYGLAMAPHLPKGVVIYGAVWFCWAAIHFIIFSGDPPQPPPKLPANRSKAHKCEKHSTMYTVAGCPSCTIERLLDRNTSLESQLSEGRTTANHSLQTLTCHSYDWVNGDGNIIRVIRLVRDPDTHFDMCTWPDAYASEHPQCFGASLYQGACRLVVDGEDIKSDEYYKDSSIWY